MLLPFLKLLRPKNGSHQEIEFSKSGSRQCVISGIPPPFPRNSVKNTSHKICHHKKKGASDQKYEFTIEFIKIGHKNNRYNVLQMRPTHSTSLNNGMHLLGSNGTHSVSCSRTEKTVIMQWHGCCAILLHVCA